VVATVVVARGLMPTRPSLKLGDLRRLLRETLPLAVATVLNTLYARIAIIFMSLAAADEATGAFRTSYRVVEVANGVPLSLIGTTFPILARAARDDAERLRYVLQRVLEIALIGGVWLSLAVGLAARPVAELLTNDPGEADQVTSALRILAAVLAPVFLNISWQTALRRHKELLVANGAAIAFICALIIGLVPPYAAEGAAVAVVLAEAFLMRAYPELRPELRLVPRVALALAVALSAAVVPAWPELARAPVASVVYFGVLAVGGWIPSEVVGGFAGLRKRSASLPADERASSG